MDVFQLQASVKIDTTDASQKLDALIEKADTLDKKLSENKTASVDDNSGSNGNNGNGSNNNSNTNNDNNGGSTPVPTNKGGNSNPVAEAGKEATEQGVNGSTLNFLKNGLFQYIEAYAPEIAFASAVISSGAWAVNTISEQDKLKNSYIKYFDFDEQQQQKAFNYVYNIHNDLPSYDDPGYTMADTAWWNFQDAVGDDVANEFNNALELWNLKEWDMRIGGYDTINLLDLFKSSNHYQFEPGYVPEDVEEVEIDTDLNAEDGAEQIQEQVGTVEIPAEINVTSVSGGGFWSDLGSTALSVGGKVLDNVKDEAINAFVDRLFKKKHANGLSYVPDDNYYAVLHKGERVMTAAENSNYTTNSNLYVENMTMNNGMDADALAAAMARQARRTRAGYGN